MTAISKVGVVGCGAMGAGIAEACARAGVDVLVVASGPGSIARGRQRVLDSMDRGVQRGKIPAAERSAALGRISFTAEMLDLADRQLVLEAVPEDEAVKLTVFSAIDKIVEADDAILASTTSSLSVARLAMVAERPERVLGLHFFNPVPVLPLVELISTLYTADAARDRAESFVTEVLGKTAIRANDRSGFTVNALLIPYLLSAVRMVESGFARAEDIDRGMTLGCAHPMGPLALIDLIGVDIVVAIGQAMYQEYQEPQHAPPPLLTRMAEVGLLGRKTGRGFYQYPRDIAGISKT